MKLNKKQKRTATIASMAALLAVVLGMGGQTFAKYISTKDVTTQATVAKWGVVISSNSDKFFGGEYGDVVTNYATVSNTGVVVSSSSNPKTNIVAPGTKGEMTFSVTGSAEVKAKYTVSVDSNDDGIADWTTINLKKEGAVVYTPIKWTVSTSTDGSSWTPVTGVEDQEDIEKVTEALAGFTATLEPNAPFTFHCKIEWKWAFDVSQENNSYDTLLGKIKAGTYNPVNDGAGYTSEDTISAYLSVTAEQVQ